MTDDGIGFDAESTRSAGCYGVVGMQERAASIGASLTVVGEKGYGVRVIVQYGKAGG